MRSPNCGAPEEVVDVVLSSVSSADMVALEEGPSSALERLVSHSESDEGSRDVPWLATLIAPVVSKAIVVSIVVELEGTWPMPPSVVVVLHRCGAA